MSDSTVTTISLTVTGQANQTTTVNPVVSTPSGQSGGSTSSGTTTDTDSSFVDSLETAAVTITPAVNADSETVVSSKGSNIFVPVGASVQLDGTILNLVPIEPSTTVQATQNVEEPNQFRLSFLISGQRRNDYGGNQLASSESDEHFGARSIQTSFNVSGNEVVAEITMSGVLKISMENSSASAAETNPTFSSSTSWYSDNNWIRWFRSK